MAAPCRACAGSARPFDGCALSRLRGLCPPGRANGHGKFALRANPPCANGYHTGLKVLVPCIISVLFLASGINIPQGDSMAYIICEPCVGTKDTACVDACPVDCIHPKKDEPEFESATMLYIHPEECIDCGACEPACPLTAILPEDNVPDQL